MSSSLKSSAAEVFTFVKRRPIVLFCGAIMLLLFVFTPWPLDRTLQLLGKACCDQAASHTIRVGGRLMPLDARDAALYLSFGLCVLVGILVGRGRAGGRPIRPLALLLKGFIVAMVIDGINSSMQVSSGHGVYTTTNVGRIWTGAGAGLALAVLAFPMWNRLVWREPLAEPVASGFGEVVGFAVPAVLVMAVLLSPQPWLYYPLSVLSSLGMLLLWGVVNTSVVVVASGRLRSFVALTELVPYLLAGLVLTLGEVGMIDLLRGGH